MLKITAEKLNEHVARRTQICLTDSSQREVQRGCSKEDAKMYSQWNSHSEIHRPEITVSGSKTPALGYLPPQLFRFNRNSLSNNSLRQKWRKGALPHPRRARDQSGSSQVKFGEETTKTILRSVIPWACALSAGTEASLFRMSDKNLAAIGLARRSPYASSSLSCSQL